MMGKLGIRNEEFEVQARLKIARYRGIKEKEEVFKELEELRLSVEKREDMKEGVKKHWFVSINGVKKDVCYLRRELVEAITYLH